MQAYYEVSWMDSSHKIARCGHKHRTREGADKCCVTIAHRRAGEVSATHGVHLPKVRLHEPNLH